MPSSHHLAQINVAKAVRQACQDAGLDRKLVELINIRVSQINGCAYCLDTHVTAALRYGETPQRIAVLPAWRDTTRRDAAVTRTLSRSTLTPDVRKVVAKERRTRLDRACQHRADELFVQ